jgi:chromosome condensin MukBEF MukE localization factor
LKAVIVIDLLVDRVVCYLFQSPKNQKKIIPKSEWFYIRTKKILKLMVGSTIRAVL